MQKRSGLDAGKGFGEGLPWANLSNTATLTSADLLIVEKVVLVDCQLLLLVCLLSSFSEQVMPEPYTESLRRSLPSVKRGRKGNLPQADSFDGATPTSISIPTEAGRQL